MFNDVVCEASEAMKKKSIIEIFNDMEYEEEESKNTDECPKINKIAFNNEMNTLKDPEIFNIKKEPKLFENAIEAAVKAQKSWSNSSTLERADSLHKICKVLKEYSNKLSKSQNEALTLLDYFDFYSDLTILTEEYKSWKPEGIVLIVLSKYCPFFVLGATVPAALAAGCSVIVLAPETAQAISLFLKEIIAEAGLLEGLFNVLTNFDEDNIPVSKKINKVFFCGSYLSTQTFYANNLSKSFNFFCPNNTTALILESSDLNAAVDKIVQATWGEKSLFAVSTVVVQESIYENFFEKLKFRIEQFMLENKNSSIFKDVIISEKINKIILEALNAGATVEKSCTHKNLWSPTVIVNYQNQNINEDVPLLKVLLCRTANEGVTLINNSKFSLGTSIWSEISSQALETSSKLVCPNIWINCHGVFQASEPLQPIAFSGDCVLGGSDGILEYMSFTQEEPSEAVKKSESKTINYDKSKILQLAISAQRAFLNWKNIENRRNYIKNIGVALNDNKELSKFSRAICTYAHFCNIVNFSERSSTQEFFIMKKKLPVGVILLIINTNHVDIASVISLITFPIILGNAVIIILKDENLLIEMLVKHYNKTLPKNVLNLTIGIKAGTYLASDPNIQAIWLYDETEISAEFLQTIRSLCCKSLKHIWVVPKSIPVSLQVFQKECLRNRIVWLTAVDQFP